MSAKAVRFRGLGTETLTTALAGGKDVLDAKLWVTNVERPLPKPVPVARPRAAPGLAA